MLGFDKCVLCDVFVVCHGIAACFSNRMEYLVLRLFIASILKSMKHRDCNFVKN